MMPLLSTKMCANSEFIEPLPNHNHRLFAGDQMSAFKYVLQRRPFTQ